MGSSLDAASLDGGSTARHDEACPCLEGLSEFGDSTATVMLSIVFDRTPLLVSWCLLGLVFLGLRIAML